MKLSQIASAVGARLEGKDVEITAVAGIEQAGPGELTFVSNPRYASAAKTTKASAVIVANDFPALATPTLRSTNPYLAFAGALELFYQPPQYAPGIHSTAVVHESARIGERAHIGAYVVIDEDVEIGDGCVLLPHVVIYRGARIGKSFFAHAHAVVREYCRLGNNVILQNGAVIGGDGFGFAKDDAGAWHKIVQSGPAVLEDNVEVQVNACVDRASVGESRGSTELGRNVILAGQVGIAGHCRIGDGVVATAQSGVPNDVEDGKTISGYPAMDNKQWLRCVAAFHRLPEIMKAVRARAADQSLK